MQTRNQRLTESYIPNLLGCDSCGWAKRVLCGGSGENHIYQKPLPVHNKIDPSPPTSRSQPGSAWNRAGTWEEKSLNHWAIPRIKELLVSVGSISFSSGRAEVEDVTKCVGDALVVVIRNKKRVSFTYELSLRVKGEWIIQGNKKLVGGHIDVPEISFGELDDLQ
ncbi:hypothetical protein RYX36_006056, partial [Vicia faba]